MPYVSSIRIPKHVLSESLNGETVLLDMSSGLYFGLSPVASRFWHLLSEGVAPDAAQATILGEFDVALNVLRADLDALLTDLTLKKLIEQ